MGLLNASEWKAKWIGFDASRKRDAVAADAGTVRRLLDLVARRERRQERPARNTVLPQGIHDPRGPRAGLGDCAS